jgi:hypothetical protein
MVQLISIFNIILATIKSCITLPPTLSLNDIMDDNIILDANIDIIEAAEGKLNLVIYNYSINTK